jgi:hypothetical protein
MNFFMNGLLTWQFDWDTIDDFEDETGVLWIHEKDEGSVLLDEEDAGYSSEEIDKSGSTRSLNVERYR